MNSEGYNYYRTVFVIKVPFIFVSVLSWRLNN